jgi:hypothetical protein
MSADPAHFAEEASSSQDGAIRDSLERLRLLLAEEGGLIGSLVADSAAVIVRSGRPLPRPSPAQLAASGPRADGRNSDYELLVEAIYEGYLLHYHAARVVRSAEDDLGLLTGDRLYALGLARLVQLGDIQAVAELADVITLTALAQADDNPDLADAVWMAGARAVGWGASPQHERAKALVRAGSPDALAAMRGLTAS